MRSHSYIHVHVGTHITYIHTYLHICAASHNHMQVSSSDNRNMLSNATGRPYCFKNLPKAVFQHTEFKLEIRLALWPLKAYKLLKLWPISKTQWPSHYITHIHAKTWYKLSYLRFRFSDWHIFDKLYRNSPPVFSYLRHLSAVHQTVTKLMTVCKHKTYMIEESNREHKIC